MTPDILLHASDCSSYLKLNLKLKCPPKETFKTPLKHFPRHTNHLPLRISSSVTIKHIVIAVLGMHATAGMRQAFE